MNEQNNNVSSNPQQANVGQTPVMPNVNQQPVASMQQQPQQTTQQPIQQEVQQAPIQPVVQQVPVQAPVQQPIQQVQPQVQEVVANPQALQQPVQQVGQDQNVGVQAAQPAIQQAPVQTQIPQSQPVQQVGQQTPVQQDIVQNQPINPITSEPFAPSTPTNGTFGPSIPIGGANDATGIGFVAAEAPLKSKKKNVPLIIGIILVVLAVLGAVGYFVIYPFIMKTYFSNPKNVYETTIKSTFKGISTTANDIVRNKAIYDIQFSFDSNIEGIKDYAGYSYTINFGVDPTNKLVQEGITAKNLSTNAENSYFNYVKDGKIYEKFSSYRDYIYSGEIGSEELDGIFSSFNTDDILNASEKINNEEIDYIINKLADLVVASIDEDKLSKEDAAIDINGKTIKVTNNKYVMDSDTINKMLTSIKDGILNDDKSIEILAKLYDSTTEEMKEQLKGIKFKSDDSTDVEDNKDVSIITNIYTYGNKNEIVGYSINTSDDELEFHYYFNKEAVDIKLYSETNNSITGEKEKNTITAIGVKGKDKTDVSIKYNDKEVITLGIKQWDEKGVNFDYAIKYDDVNFSGNIKFASDVNDKRAKYDFEVSVKGADSEYINVTLNISEDWTSEVSNINTDSAVTLTDEEIKVEREKFVKALTETPIGKLFTTVSGDYDSSIDDYYNAIEEPKDDDNSNSNVINNEL